MNDSDSADCAFLAAVIGAAVMAAGFLLVGIAALAEVLFDQPLPLLAITGTITLLSALCVLWLPAGLYLWTRGRQP